MDGGQELKAEQTNLPPLTWRERLVQFGATHWQKGVAVFIWGSIAGSVWFYANQNSLTPVGVVQNLAGLFQTPAGVFFYILLYILRPLIFFPASWLTIAGGSIFGPVWGIPIVVIASNSSSIPPYFVGRFLGQGVLDESAGLIQKYAQRLRHNSFETVLLMRLIFLPYDLVHYMCGFLKIDLKAFVLATALGSLPGTVAYVLFGASIDIQQGLTSPEFNPLTLVTGLVIVGFSIGLSRYFKRREQLKEKA